MIVRAEKEKEGPEVRKKRKAEQPPIEKLTMKRGGLKKDEEGGRTDGRLRRMIESEGLHTTY